MASGVWVAESKAFSSPDGESVRTLWWQKVSRTHQLTATTQEMHPEAQVEVRLGERAGWERASKPFVRLSVWLHNKMPSE